MKKLWLFLVFLLLTYGSVFASPFPDPAVLNANPELLPPPIEGDFPEQSSFELEKRRRPVTDPEHMDLGNASGIYHYTPKADLSSVEPFPEFSESANSFPGFGGFTTDSTVIGSLNVTNDDNQDVEPTIIAIEKNGTVYTTTAYFKYLDNGDPRLYYSTTTDFSSFSSAQLPLPWGYTWSVDPLLDENWYTNGIAPKRIYLTGLLIDYVPSYTRKSAIALWHSDNGGISWSWPTIVAEGTNTSGNVDKPDVAISWHSGSRGYVYVAYVILNGSNSELWIKRSTDGGLTFPVARLVEVRYINGAQVVVSPYSGNVYVIWTDFEINAIQMSTSYNYGLTWTVPETPASGNMLKPADYINGPMKAGSIPMARFNWVANKVSIVWHECATTFSSYCPDTDVYYMAKSPSGWQPKVTVNDVTTGDQFMPALDFDSTGNMIVTFYDRRDDWQNIGYHLYSARINSGGNRLEPNIRVSTFQSDPRKYPYTVDGKYFIGDYQDVWSQDFGGVEYYLPSWVGIPDDGDIWISAIQP